MTEGGKRNRASTQTLCSKQKTNSLNLVIACGKTTPFSSGGRVAVLLLCVWVGGAGKLWRMCCKLGSGRQPLCREQWRQERGCFCMAADGCTSGANWPGCKRRYDVSRLWWTLAHFSPLFSLASFCPICSPLGNPCTHLRAASVYSAHIQSHCPQFGPLSPQRVSESDVESSGWESSCTLKISNPSSFFFTGTWSNIFPGSFFAIHK